MGANMNLNTFRQQALAALESIFAFAEFTKHSESLFEDEKGDSEFVQRYKEAWFELEIVNSVALEEWESDGRPKAWAEKWNDKYREEAAEVVHQLLQVVEGKG